jgi:hypothetical protein
MILTVGRQSLALIADVERYGIRDAFADMRSLRDRAGISP